MNKQKQDQKLTLSSEETEKEKRRLIELVREELKIHGLVDLTGYIDENAKIDKSHTHSGFVRSVAYKLEKMGIVEVVPVENWQRFYIKELTWDKKHPFLHAMRISFANSIFYVIAGVLITLIGSKIVKQDIDNSGLQKTSNSQQSMGQQKINDVQQQEFNYSEDFDKFLIQFNQDSVFQLSRISFPHEQIIIDGHEGGEALLYYDDTSDWSLINLEYKPEYSNGMGLEFRQDTIWNKQTVTIKQLGADSSTGLTWNMEFEFSIIDEKWHLTASKDISY